MAWAPDSAQRLLASEDFRDLFEDPNSPLAAEIESLERMALNPSTPLQDKQDAVCRRVGILKVWATVIGMVEANAKRQNEPPPRPRIESRYLRRSP